MLTPGRNRGWNHVLFHGRVPGKQRKDLVRRFREDPDCRVFLSTDAGGVGLNLQRASVVVNMDQPWNPAVLEQRIGRVHRLGQHRPVSVINYVAQGTIEHGMLSLIDFKKSVFAGVLDGGSDEVFLGGTRLKRFMESVERATETIPPAMPQQKELSSEVAADAQGIVDEPPSDTDALWTELATAGLSFLEKLGRALQPAAASDAEKRSAQGAGLPETLLGRDERTGKAYLKLPLPGPEVIQGLTQLLGRLSGPKKR